MLYSKVSRATATQSVAGLAIVMHSSSVTGLISAAKCVVGAYEPRTRRVQMAFDCRCTQSLPVRAAIHPARVAQAYKPLTDTRGNPCLVRRPDSNFVNVLKQVSRILVHSVGASAIPPARSRIPPAPRARRVRADRCCLPVFHPDRTGRQVPRACRAPGDERRMLG